MELGKVRGQVVSTVRDPGVPHVTLLLVDLVNAEGDVIRPAQVAADTLGAGEGELVLLVRGSSARFTMNERPPLDLSVIGIIDQISAQGEMIYNK
ncbi:MAG: EutN/CcmL family microcompartment protein [Desulfovibrionales bacterium]|nr:EutN/CcmL family microcompartment protein [Desulfovibrionales bacterium]